VDRPHLLGAPNACKIAVDFALENSAMFGSLTLVGLSLGDYRFSEEKRRRIVEVFSVAR